MLYVIVFAQVCMFMLFFVLERYFPARQLIRAKSFTLFWTGINIFAVAWVKIVWVAWVAFPSWGVDIGASVIVQGFVFYLVYSFCNYWFHRFKHRNTMIWKYFHRFHHSPSKMETMVAFYKHPLEIILNTGFILLLSLPFAVSPEAVALALALEGCLEVYHHSNIRTPKKLRWIGYIIQIPEMHLVHHQYGLHKYNYVAFLWDSVFGTARIPSSWEGRQGFASSFDVKNNFLLKTS